MGRGIFIFCLTLRDPVPGGMQLLHGPVPLLQEHSQKSGIVLPGVLLNKQKVYTGSDLDMTCNLDILLPLDTLGALSVLLFLVSGSTPNRLFFCQWEYLLFML